MTSPLRPVVGLVTIGQSPRADIVPDMAAIIGPGIDIREAGALDGLSRAEVEALKPTGDDEILVTRLQDGTGVFVGKQKIVRLVEERKTTAGNARKVLEILAKEGGDPAAIIEREGLGAMADDGELAGIVAQVIADNPDVVERIKGGNPKAMGALVGPIMKATRGRADGGEVNRLIRQHLEL